MRAGAERGVFLGAGPGRGAWVCLSTSCVELLGDRDLSRTLRRGFSAEDLAKLRTDLLMRVSVSDEV